MGACESIRVPPVWSTTLVCTSSGKPKIPELVDIDTGGIEACGFPAASRSDILSLVGDNTCPGWEGPSEYDASTVLSDVEVEGSGGGGLETLLSCKTMVPERGFTEQRI